MRTGTQAMVVVVGAVCALVARAELRGVMSSPLVDMGHMHQHDMGLAHNLMFDRDHVIRDQDDHVHHEMDHHHLLGDDRHAIHDHDMLDHDTLLAHGTFGHDDLLHHDGHDFAHEGAFGDVDEDVHDDFAGADEFIGDADHGIGGFHDDFHH
ncbi:hypothetical protein PBRA_000733 [Plasmodiophora brassicae]|uniref:Uncharacterized protein n=1 Tax=Plasmodiophora brassicae TaxID=37360 RepID=A0A0G4IPV5_PLABS|nr:hypothetical protein PBRA_000733 [Plasmodiophora brassicae]